MVSALFGRRSTNPSSVCNVAPEILFVHSSIFIHSLRLKAKLFGWFVRKEREEEAIAWKIEGWRDGMGFNLRSLLDRVPRWANINNNLPRKLFDSAEFSLRLRLTAPSSATIARPIFPSDSRFHRFPLRFCFFFLLRVTGFHDCFLFKKYFNSWSCFVVNWWFCLIV